MRVCEPEPSNNNKVNVHHHIYIHYLNTLCILCYTMLWVLCQVHSFSEWVIWLRQFERVNFVFIFLNIHNLVSPHLFNQYGAFYHTIAYNSDALRIACNFYRSDFFIQCTQTSKNTTELHKFIVHMNGFPFLMYAYMCERGLSWMEPSVSTQQTGHEQMWSDKIARHPFEKKEPF